MTVLEYGSVREIFTAPVNDSATKKSFLIRDDAYSLSSATLGRTLRLGDPIDTGPSSAEYQTSWSGGLGQALWSDKTMVLDSNMDTTDLLGQVRPWEGWSANYKDVTATTSYVTAMYTVDGVTPANPIIVFGTSDGYVYYKTSSGSPTLISSLSSAVLSISKFVETSTSAASLIAVGTNDGQLWTIDINTWTATDVSHPTTSERAAIRSMCTFGTKMAIAMGDSLWTRDSGATWVKVKQFTETGYTLSVSSTGSNIYVLAQGYGPFVDAYVSNGSVASFLYRWKDAFGGECLAHNGAVYFYVNRYKVPRSSPTSYIYNPSLYSYNGASMRLIHDRSDWNIWGDTEQYGETRLCLYKEKIAFSYNGGTRFQTAGFTNRYAGFLLYDPTNDSIHHGPSFGPTGTISVTAMTPYHNGVALAVKTASTPSSSAYRHIIVTRTDGGIDHQNFSGILGASLSSVHSTARRHYILSSMFDANLPTQTKTWLGMRVQAAVATGNTATFHVRADIEPSATTKYQIGTWAGSSTPPGSPAATALSTYNYDAINAGSSLYYPSATTFQYVVELSSTAASAGGTSSYTYDTYIESIAVTYMLAATNRRVWRVRALCSDGQLTLAGAANSLTTGAAQASHLYGLWSGGRPFYFWEPGTGTVPSSTANAYLVQATDYVESSFLVNNNGTDVVKEISLTLYQIA